MSKLLFFDLETTGVKFWRNGIHQIGGIVDIDGQEAERFDIRLAPNPAATIEQEALDVAVPEIKEDHCTGCCFYNEGSCLIRDQDHVDFPDCHDSGMIWMRKEINISDIKEKAIKLAIEVMKPIPVCSSPCYSISDSRSPEEKHEEEMRFCKDLNDLRCEMLIDMAKKIEEYLLQDI